MRKTFTLSLLTCAFLISILSNTNAQSCFPTGLNGTVVNLSCGQTCTNMNFQVPHLKSTSTYVVNSIPYNPLQYIVATGGTEDPILYADDKYSNKFTLPFQFCLYDSTFSKAVIGSNGLITFDTLNSACSNAYTMGNTIPYAGGTRCGGISPDYYPKSSIMGVFTDLDPRVDHAPADCKIQWRVEGVAPCRKFVVSYYHVGTFGDNCGLTADSSNTFQMVMYESTGLIDVYIENKSCESSTNSPGYSIMGVQNWNQNQAVAAPGKNLTVWEAHNEGYRFTPNGAVSRFVSSGLYTMSGTLVQTADTSTSTVGLLDISFPNICPGVTTQYVIKTIFEACPSGTQLISMDTITIAHINTLTGATTTTPTSCGASVGTITATVTGGTGTPPFTYTIAPPPATGPATNNTGIFTNLAAGPYTISITDAVSCPVTLNETVTALSSLAGTYSSTATSCAGQNNGTITVTPQGVAPYSFTLTGPGGPYTQSSPVFNNMPAGTYTLTYTDGVPCNGTIPNIVVAQGPTPTANAVKTNTTCAGATDGTITITPTVPGSYSYTLNPGAITNTTGIFTGLAPNTYSVTFTNTATGCAGTVSSLTVAVGGSIPATWAHTQNETCPGANDGILTITPSVAGTYTFTLNPAPGVGPATNTTGIFQGITPNIFYDVTFSNAAGCTGNMTFLFVLAASPVTATEAHTNATCPGVNDGTITITPNPAGTYTYTLTPGPVVNGTGIFPGLSAGTYSVAFQNAGGCGGTVNNIVIGPGAAGGTTTATVTNATCTGVSDGTITVTPPASGGPFTYTLNPGNVTQNNNPLFTGLAAGTYTIVYGTAAGCGGTIAPDPVVSAGAAPVATATTVSATCPGVNNGTITVTPPATGGPFIYTLNPGNIVQNNNPVFTGLAPGTYTISFTTAIGCIGTVSPDPVVAAGSVPASISAVSVATTCPGVNDGTITITPPATGGPFIYTLNPGNIVQNNNPVFTGLAPNTYTITYTTAIGCIGVIAPDPVVTTGTAPTATATTTATLCPGVSDGTITITPPATGGPFIYTLNPGPVVQNNNPVFTGLAAGTYTITFTTSQGCSGTVPTDPVITSGTAPTATAVATATTCPGVNDGTITITPPATGGPFIYTLNPGAIVQNNNPVFTGLAPDTYTITFTTAAGCSGTVPTNTVVNTGASPTATAVATTTTCPSVNDGTITITPPATGGPFVYTLNPGNVVQNNNPVFTGLAPDSYTITFTTALGCSGTVPTNTVVNAGAAPTTTATATATTCPGVSDGIVTVTPPSTGGPFVYTLNPGNVVQNDNPVFVGLAPDTYTITFTTALGCNGTVPVNPVIVAGPPITANPPTIVNPPCANINDGTLTIVPSLPGVYTYVLNPGLPTEITQVNNPTFTGLAPGTYNYNFTNPSGCVGTGSATLTTHAPLALGAVLTMPLCNGNANGVITITASGGLAAYEYALSPFTTYQAGGTFNGLAAGTYTFRVRDNAGCTKDTTVTLAEPTLLTASAVSTVGTCNGNDGQITITATDGTPSYTYSIDGTNYQQSPTFIVSGGPGAGAYYPNVTAMDNNGCIANAGAQYVTLTDNMGTLYIGNDTTICAEQTVTFDPQVSPQATVFLWTTIPDPSLVNTLNSDTIKNAIATPLDTTTYVLHATWGVCSRIDTMTINVLRKPVPYAGQDTAVCYDRTTAVLHGSATNLSGTVNFEWSDTTNLQTPHGPVTVATPTQTENFTLTVTDNYGCNFSVTDIVTVTVKPPVPAFAGNDTIAVLGQPHMLMGSGGVEYAWLPTYPLSLANIQNPMATLTHDQQFTVTVTDEIGCVGYDTVFVQVYQGPTYYVPNAFSPNGDGLNDVFRVIPPGISYTDWFRVFNRYGELVFETNKWLKGWDGTYKGKKQPTGNYVWILKGVDKNGKVIEMKGTVLLIQ